MGLHNSQPPDMMLLIHAASVYELYRFSREKEKKNSTIDLPPLTA